MDLLQIQQKMGREYHFRTPEKMALRSLLSKGGMGVAIFEGSPGTGKTYFAECLARATQAEYVYYLCHNWTTDEDLFVGVDIGRVAAGVTDPAEAYRDGVLLRAVRASLHGSVVLCLDELDKAPQRAESLLLNFLETARVYGPRGEVYQGNARNITVVITTNGMRPLMEATQRRGFRVTMTFLPANVERDILKKATGAKNGLIHAVVETATLIRTKGISRPSIKEMISFVSDTAFAADATDVDALIDGWLIKDEADRKALPKNIGAILWGEVCR